MELFCLADYSELFDFVIVDMVIHCCTNCDCNRKLMTKGNDVTVKTCLDLLRQYEVVNMAIKHLEETCKVNATYSRDPTKQSQRNGSKTKQSQKSSLQLEQCPDHHHMMLRIDADGAVVTSSHVKIAQPKKRSATSVIGKVILRRCVG